jgi:hypothetical protein
MLILLLKKYYYFIYIFTYVYKVLHDNQIYIMNFLNVEILIQKFI